MIWKTNSRDWKATFYKRNRHENREHEFLEARIKQPTREGRRETRDRRGSIIVSCFSIHFDYAWYIFFDENIPLFSSLHDDTRFLPVATSHQRYPSSLTLASTTDSISLGLLFAYKVATHPNVTFYLQLPRRWNRGTVFPFPPFSFASLFRPPFLPVLLSIHFSTGLRLIIGILCFLIFPPIRWFPSLSTVSLPNTPSTPSRALDSIRWNSYTSRMVSFISIGWMWFPYFSQLNEFYLCRVYTSRWIMLIININEEKSKKISKRFKLPLWAYFNEIWNLKEKKKRMHGKRCNLMDGKNLR